MVALKKILTTMLLSVTLKYTISHALVSTMQLCLSVSDGCINIFYSSFVPIRVQTNDSLFLIMLEELNNDCQST